MQNSMMLFTFFVFDWKCPFWTNLVQKIKNVSLRWNLMPRLTRICRIQWRCSLFFFRPEIIFLGNFCSKNKDCQFKLKFGTQNNWNMQNSLAMYTLSVLDQKYPFWANFVQKVKIVSLSWNLVASLIWIWRI